MESILFLIPSWENSSNCLLCVYLFRHRIFNLTESLAVSLAYGVLNHVSPHTYTPASEIVINCC